MYFFHPPQFELCSVCFQGSDIETLGSEAAAEYGAEVLERPPVVETKLQDTQAPASAGKGLYVFGPSLTVTHNTICELSY